MADASYLDIVVFLEDRNGKKHPKTIGWGKIENGECKGRIDLIPAASGWDGSFKIQQRREKGAAAPARQAAPNQPDPSDDVPF